MENMSAAFSTLIDKIVFTELNETEKEQYSLEGPELINELFESKNLEAIQNKVDLNFDYSLQPGAPELIKMSVDFIAIISSIFAIYLNVIKGKNDALQSKMDSFELKTKLKNELLKRNLSGELTEKISEKYDHDLLDLYNNL